MSVMNLINEVEDCAGNLNEVLGLLLKIILLCLLMFYC